MITIDALKEMGCNVEEGLHRCMDNEDFYLMLVNKSLKDEQIVELKQSINDKNLKRGFEVAHALKGVYGNLSITPLYEVVVEITELLRKEADVDYHPYLDKIETLYNQLKALAQ